MAFGGTNRVYIHLFHAKKRRMISATSVCTRDAGSRASRAWRRRAGVLKRREKGVDFLENIQRQELVPRDVYQNLAKRNVTNATAAK